MAELGPTTVYGDLITTGDFYAKGTNGIYFNDTNTEIWEASSHLSFKDTVASIGVGTTRLIDLQIRKAFVNGAVPAQTYVSCFLDTDTTGTAIVVDCTIAGGGTLDGAIPRLADGMLIYVIYDESAANGDWRCVHLFQASCVSATECA